MNKFRASAQTCYNNAHTYIHRPQSHTGTERQNIEIHINTTYCAPPGVDDSLSSYTDNCKNIFLVLGEGSTDEKV